MVVAHGLSRDAPAAMREITLLDPNWLTGAIYALLNSPVIRDQGGEFSRGQLDELLDSRVYPSRWHEFILDMMEDPDLGLCFELPGSRRERYLIPEALPANEPEHDMWPADSLLFRFSYDFLPPGLIPEFIVQANRNLTATRTRWRTGVVLGVADCRILVRGDRDRRRIDIAVDGPATRQRSALNVVVNDLEAVHARNPESGAKPLVPLIDWPELHVSYGHLLKLEERYGLDYKFVPEDADRSYTVGELLEGVRRDETWSREEDGWQIREQHNKGGARPSIRQDGIEQGVDGDRLGGAKLSIFSSWRFFSFACGIGAVIVPRVLLLLPSTELRATVAALIGFGLLVTAFMLRMNPRHFYRRMLSYVIPAGLLINALGFSLDAFDSSDPATAWFRWNGAVSDWFYFAWLVVVGMLVNGDTRQSR